MNRGYVSWIPRPQCLCGRKFPHCVHEWGKYCKSFPDPESERIIESVSVKRRKALQRLPNE